MNKTIRLVLVSAAIATVSQAAPFMAVGDGAELFATGVIGVRADDNVLLEKDGKSDVIFDIAPGLELDFGKNAQVQGSLTLVDSFAVYLDNDDLNTNLFAGNFVAKYDDGKSKMNFNAGYNELAQNSVDVRSVNGKLVRRDISSIGGSGEVSVSDVTAVTAGVDFRHEDYHGHLNKAGYVDSDVFNIPVNVYYKWTPKLDVGLGYQYSNYQAKSTGAADSTDHFFSIAGRGEFSPMLTGKLALGYIQRKFSGGGDDDLFGIDSSFAYEVSPKSTVQFGVSNLFGTSPTGAQQKNLVVNTLVTSKLTEQWSANGGVSYRRITYPTRSDDYWEATIGAAYTMSANVKIIGSYVFRTYQTDIAASEFDNNVFSIAANLRY